MRTRRRVVRASTRSVPAVAQKPGAHRGRRARHARRPRGVWSRGPALAAAAAVVALGSGVAAGAGYDALREASRPPVEARSVPPADPQACAVAQVAWSRAAAAHATMSQDEPATVRDGYVDARAVLAGVEPPPAVAADWSTYAAYVDTVAAAVAEAPDDTAVANAAAEAFGAVDADAVLAAAERVTTYLSAGCLAAP